MTLNSFHEIMIKINKGGCYMNFNPDPKNIPTYVMFDVLSQISKYHKVDSYEDLYNDAVSVAFQSGYIEDNSMNRYNLHAFEKDYTMYSIYLSPEGQRKLAELKEHFKK